MKKAVRCFLSCIFPCGALDVIRIVHCSGKVEEISGKVRASEIMEAYPKHVLKKPSASSYDSVGAVSKIVIVPPDAELQRGKIYFLMPVPNSTKSAQENGSSNSRRSSSSTTRKKKKKKRLDHDHEIDEQSNVNMSMRISVQNSDQCCNEILTETISTHGERKRGGGHVGVWRPSLDSVSETLSICSGKSDE